MKRMHTYALLALTIALAGRVLRADDDHAERIPGGGFAENGALHFRYPARPVKVVVLAGSIGAYRDQPYPRVLQEVCSNIEVRNLSVVGMGAYPLHQRFLRDVVPYLPRGEAARDPSVWLLWNGGLNSVDNSLRTNEYIRRTFVGAHQQHMRVFALTLGPWGSDRERTRWGGSNGLHTLIHTQRIVDFVLSRVRPTLALARVDGERNWEDNERADIAVDLYNSVLRDRDAVPRDLEAVLQSLRADRAYMHEVARAGRDVEADAQLLADAPRWFLRPELQSFDTTHPNRAGHAIIANLICQSAPQEWGCDCRRIAPSEP